MTEQVTKEFSVTHATVHYPGDNRNESIRFDVGFIRDGSFVTFDSDDDDWKAHYHEGYYGDDCVYLNVNHGPHNRTIFSQQNYRKIETNWTEDLVAVAEVNVTEEREGRLICPDIVTHTAEIEDLTIWEKMEWEVHNDE